MYEHPDQRTFVIDIETLPTGAPFEDRLFWKTEDEYRRTALDGTLGRILCIGWARMSADGSFREQGCLGWDGSEGRFGTGEETVLREFWEMLEGFDARRDLVVGHNIMDFDLPFIVRRSIVHGVRPTVGFCFARYRKRPIFDTMREWDCWNMRECTSLEKLALALGLPSPKDGGISGADVYDAWLEGSHEEIRDYCLRDVLITGEIYRKMRFIERPEELSGPEISLGLAG